MPDKVDTAVFYSISNCQRGLAGVSFGNFLIKQVVEEVSTRQCQAQDLRDAVAGAGLCRPGCRRERAVRARRAR